MADALVELQQLMQQYNYDHALDGNLHFIFSPGFQIDAEVQRYHEFMDVVCKMLIEHYDGSLKAAQTLTMLEDASQQGEIPVYCDTSQLERACGRAEQQGKTV